MDFEWLWYVSVGSSLLKNALSWWVMLQGGRYAYEGQGVYGKSLYLPLNFVVNLKLFSTIKSFENLIILKQVICYNTIVIEEMFSLIQVSSILWRGSNKCDESSTRFRVLQHRFKFRLWHFSAWLSLTVLICKMQITFSFYGKYLQGLSHEILNANYPIKNEAFSRHTLVFIISFEFVCQKLRKFMEIHSHFPTRSCLGQDETCVNSHLQLFFSFITLTNQMSLSAQNREVGSRRIWTLVILEPEDFGLCAFWKSFNLTTSQTISSMTFYCFILYG